MQPDIYIGALRISEPVVALTGLGIAVICGYAWGRLRRGKHLAPACYWMRYFFALMAVSAVIGPFFGHAFFYWAGFSGKYACWIFSIFSLGALAQAAIEHARPFCVARLYRGLTFFNLIMMSAAITLSGLTQSFIWVEAHSALVLLGLMLPLEMLVYAKRRDPGSRLLLWSLSVAVFAIIPVALKWSPGVWFSSFDVGHVVLYGFFWITLHGAERLEDHRGSV